MTHSRPRPRTIVATQQLAGDNDRFGFGVDRVTSSLRVVDALGALQSGTVIQVGPPFAEHLQTLHGIPAAGTEAVNS